MMKYFKNLYYRFMSRMTIAIGFLWEFMCISKFIIEGKSKERFLNSSVDMEIRNLKRNNKKYKIYKYNLYIRIIDYIERNKISSALVVLGLIITSYLISRKLEIWSFTTKEQLAGIEDFQRFAATIQVTLFAVVVPFSTAILEFVFKDFQSKIDLIRLVHKETKVLFLTVSSIILTIVIFLSEYLSVVFDVSSNIAAVSITTIWLIINTVGIGYFIINGLRFLTPYYRYSALAKYVANEVYPNELKGYIRRNIYIGLSTTDKEN